MRKDTAHKWKDFMERLRAQQKLKKFNEIVNDSENGDVSEKVKRINETPNKERKESGKDRKGSKRKKKNQIISSSSTSDEEKRVEEKKVELRKWKRIKKSSKKDCTERTDKRKDSGEDRKESKGKVVDTDDMFCH